MFIYKTSKFAPVSTIILKIRAIFVHQTLTEHALCQFPPVQEPALILLKRFIPKLLKRTTQVSSGLDH